MPNPRSISLILSNDNHQFDIARTSINSAFAQFIDHDYTAVAPSSGRNFVKMALKHSIIKFEPFILS